MEIQTFKFAHGQSNPTYLIRIDGKPRIVLRKKPPPPILPSAHAIEREFRVLSALYQAGFPVPQPVTFCHDASILGTPFYLMEFVDGDIFESCDLSNVDTGSRRHIYFQMAKTLANLHSIDPSSIGLGDYGKAQGYAARQVEIWYKQFVRSQDRQEGRLWEKMSSLYDALRNRAGGLQPTHDACIAHGDYRLDNLIFDRESHTVLGLLDWELSTLGDPIADLAYSCLPYYIPRHILPQMALPKDPLPPGIPTKDEYVQVYCNERNISIPTQDDWNFYVSLALFRLASILAGVWSRSQKGNASSQHAALVSSEEHVLALVETSAKLLAPPVSDSSIHGNQIFIGDGGSRIRHIVGRLRHFMKTEIMPVEDVLTQHAQSDNRWTIHPIQEKLKRQAKSQGLWNLWISPDLAQCMTSLIDSCNDCDCTREQVLGPGLSNAEYAMCAEIMGYSPWSSEIFNCSAPDTGNMEVLARYGTLEQQQRWLLPLLKGDIRSCFAMTEQHVASSDATNIMSSIVLDESCASYILNGKKWWTSGACDPRCRVAIFMGKTQTTGPVHTQQSMVLVPMPHPGIKGIKPLTVFGYDDAPHGHAEMTFEDVRVPKENIILGEGRGFEIAQGRLGPGRLHHCMRLVGMGQRALDLCLDRVQERRTFGKKFLEHQSIREDIARCRIELDAARLMVLNAAAALDKIGAKAARSQISEAKVYTPACVLGIVDRVIQIFGGAGVSDKFPLASMYSAARTLRLADGPDNVHLETIAKVELRRASL